MLSKLQNKNYRAYFKDIVTSNGSRFDSDRLKLTVEKKKQIRIFLELQWANKFYLFFFSGKRRYFANKLQYMQTDKGSWTTGLIILWFEVN